MTRALCLALAALLTAGCASKVRPLEGQTTAQMDADRAECSATARSTGRGDFGRWWFGPGVGWWPVDAALLGLGLIGSGVRYVVTHEQNVGALTDMCLTARGYKLPEQEP